MISGTRREQRVEHLAGGLTGGDLRVLGAEIVAHLGDHRVEVLRQVTLEAALEFGAPVGGRGGETLFPFLPHGRPARAGLPPFGIEIVGDDKRAVFPAQPLLGALDLLGAERAAMRRGGAGLGRRAERDRRPAGDQARPVVRLRPADRGGDLVGVEPVDALGLPAMRAEAFELVVGNRKARCCRRS